MERCISTKRVRRLYRLRKCYNLDNKIKVVKAEFPSTGFGIAQGGFVAMDYKTREEAERVREDIIENRIQSYLAEVR